MESNPQPSALEYLFSSVEHIAVKSPSVCVFFEEFPAQDGADLHVCVLPGASLPTRHHRLLTQRLQGLSQHCLKKKKKKKGQGSIWSIYCGSQNILQMQF